MTEQEHARHLVQQHLFALIDSALFLDTHPEDAAALHYYERIKQLYQQAEQEYEKHFGPLSHPSSGERWNWVDGPWPWEGAQ